ncbi:MAG TPA: hypothetical protein VGJ56_07290 [Reyranella sp.]
MRRAKVGRTTDDDGRGALERAIAQQRTGTLERTCTLEGTGALQRAASLQWPSALQRACALKRTSAINRVRALEWATTLQRAGALNGIVVLRAIALCIGTGDRSVVVGIGALERTHGALRLLRILIAVLLLTGRLRERSTAAEQHKGGHDTLRF